MNIALTILTILLSPLIFAFGLLLIFVIDTGAVILIEVILRCAANVFNGIGNWFTKNKK